MITSVATVLARADAATLAEIVGEAGAALLGALGQGTPDALRTVALGLHGPHGLLADAAHRDALLRLLRPSEALALADVLNVEAATPDALADAIAARPPRRGSAAHAALFAAFGLRVPEAAHADAAPPTTAAAPGYPLFAHQRRALAEAVEALAARPHRAVLHMPTGSGKTRTAMHLVARHLREQPAGGVVVWLVYGEELCEQAAAEFERAWAHVGDRPVAVARFWGDRPLALPADGFVVASLPKLYALAMRSVGDVAEIARAASLVVVDEAHQAVAPTFALVLDALARGTGTPLLGLTATPGRTWDDVDADAALARFFGGRKVTLRLDGYDNPVDGLTAEGFLAQARFESLHHDGALALTARDEARLARAFDVPADVLARLADDERRNAAIVSRLDGLLGAHARVIVFAATVAHAGLLATVLRARGAEAYSVDATTPPGLRRERLDRFRSADTSCPVALCNYGILTTGFDAPRTSAALVARPTHSLVLYSQMVGRALRGPRAGGNETAEVVTVVDRALPGFGSVADAFVNWEDVWTPA